MRFPPNRFYYNFSGAYKAKDSEITAALLNHELAYLVINNKKDLKDGFRQVGISLPKNAKNSDYVNAIIKNGGNRKVNIMLAYYIAEKNKKELEKNSSFLQGSDSADQTNAYPLSETPAPTPTDNTGGLSTASSSGTVGAIAGAIGDVYDLVNASEQNKAQVAASQNDLMAAVNNASTPAKSNSSNVLWYVFGGLVLITGVIVYLQYEKNGKINWFKKSTPSPTPKAELGTAIAAPAVEAPKIETPTIEAV